jgi:hypothetical protein
MDVPIIALMRLVAGRMAVHTARTGNHLCRFAKQRPRAGGATGDLPIPFPPPTCNANGEIWLRDCCAATARKDEIGTEAGAGNYPYHSSKKI